KNRLEYDELFDVSNLEDDGVNSAARFETRCHGPWDSCRQFFQSSTSRLLAAAGTQASNRKEPAAVRTLQTQERRGIGNKNFWRKITSSITACGIAGRKLLRTAHMVNVDPLK